MYLQLTTCLCCLIVRVSGKLGYLGDGVSQPVRVFLQSIPYVIVHGRCTQAISNDYKIKFKRNY
jgi:hypothetical protein